MFKTRLRKNSNPHKILQGLVLGAGVLTVSLLSPLGGTKIVQNMIRGYVRRKSFERKRLLQDLNHLQESSLIDFRELADGKVRIALTKAGKEKVLRYELDNIQLKRPERWDGKWRLVLFDIPHKHKNARDALRQKLNALRFYPLQKSVFITPYPCEDEIDFIASIFDVNRYILLLYVSHFEGERKLKHYFQL